MMTEVVQVTERMAVVETDRGYTIEGLNPNTG
jgi:hypothetical protein